MNRMKKNLWEFFTVLSILTLTIVACIGCESDKTGNSIKLAVAADFAETAERLGDDFTDRTGITVVVTSDSSGALVIQIQSGAVFDAFLSADTDFPRQLIMEGLAVPEPVLYAIGKLALYSLDQDLSTDGPALLAAPVPSRVWLLPIPRRRPTVVPRFRRLRASDCLMSRKKPWYLVKTLA